MSASESGPWRILPERPNLEQLKKQAKELLRDYARGDAEAAAEVARVEKSASTSQFTLADAQRVLARAYGFASWSALKQHVDGRTVARFCEAARDGDVARLREMTRARPELAGMDLAENDENRALHFAVRNRHPEAVRVLMEAGADARQGVYPNREATTALRIASDRGYTEIVAIIEQAEQDRRKAASCPNSAVTPVQEQINAAIRGGKSAEAIALLSADASLIKACDREGGSPLHVAAGALDAEMVQWLLARHANVRKTDLADRTPLDRAVFAVEPRNRGSLERFRVVGERLRHHGAPLTPAAAVAMGDAESVGRMHRANPGQFSPGVMPVNALTLAVRHRQLEMLRFLLDLRLDPDERERLKNVEGEVYSAGNPLWYAVLGDDWEAAVLLLDRGADPNANVYASGTATSQAFGTRNLRMQKLMTDRGGLLNPEFVGLYRQTERARRLLDGSEPHSVNAQAYAGPTLAEQLLWGAACGGDPEIVRLAIAQIDWPREDPRWFNMAVQPLRIWNHGPGHWTGGYDRSTYPSCFEQVIARCDVNIVDRQGATLLHRVASDGSCWGQEVMTAEERLGFATMLLDAGARFEGRDILLQSTPLAWAARWGRRELAELYLSRGAPKHEADAAPWATPLAWAVRYGHAEIARLLE